MLHKTNGIVLHTTKFNDKMLLVHVLTEEFGRVTYGIAPGSSRKGSRKSAFFQPFSILEMEVEHKAGRDIHRIKECKPRFPLTNIQFEPVKISVSLFLAGFLSRTLKDRYPNKLLFDFVSDSIRILDLSTKGIANFHLVFLFKLTRFLGFYPNTEQASSDTCFDMMNGVFVSERPFHAHYLLPADTRVFQLLMRMNYENMHLFSFSRKDRVAVIERIIEYYRLHLTEFSASDSLEILKELFD